MILAGIDIGTNAMRLVIADVGAGVFRELASDRTITRLGQDLDRTKLLAPEAQERSLRALNRFSRTLSSYPDAVVSAVGTSALRNARNADLFIRSVKEQNGLELRVINGEEEARLTLLGVRKALSRESRTGPDPLASAVVVDSGGGSTELIVTRGGSIERMESLHLGSVYLTERHVRHDPPLARELDSLRVAIGIELDAWARGLEQEQGMVPSYLTTLVGTAGTITTLAAMDLGLERYDAERINGHILQRLSLDRMLQEVSGMTLEQRRHLTGLEAGREDIILAGGLICQGIMERCEKQDLLVSDWGLREGIVFDLYEKLLRR